MRPSIRGRRFDGFILLPVVLLLSLIAATAYLAARETSLTSSTVGDSTDHDKARLAAEAGLQRATVQAHTKGCAGLYPIPILSPVKDTAFDGATYNASVWPLSGSPVTLSSTGTYGSASVSLTRANVPMHQATPATVNLQPGAAAGVDTYLKSTGSGNYGTSASINVVAGTTYGMLQFDLSSIPVGAHVTSATLSTYATAGSGSDVVTLHRVTRNWTEAALWASADGGTTAWTTPGGDIIAAPVASVSFAGSAGWLNWDVTELTDRWVKGSLPNQGVQIHAGAAISSLALASSDSGTAAQWPKLSVTFLPPCGWVPPDTTVTLAPLADLDIDQAIPTTNYGSATDLWVSHEGIGQDEHIFMQFDSSGIAAGKTITKATLRLYLGSLSGALQTGAAVTVKAYAATKAWNELQATWTKRLTGSNWSTQGGDYSGTVSGSVTLPAATLPGVWVEWDITALMQSWVDGVTTNNGLALVVTTTTMDQLIFNSRENLLNPPQLVVLYH